MTDKRVVEWFHHPLIEALDNYVEAEFDKQCRDDYYCQFNAIHISDWKPEITRWIQERVDMFTTLQDMVDELPDDEEEEYELDE